MAVDLAAARRKLQELREREKNSSFPWTELKEGENLLRILACNDGTFYVETAIHYIKHGKDSIAITCNQAHDGSDCWDCEKRNELFRTKNSDDKQEAMGLRANPRVYFNVLNRANKNKHEVLGCGNQLFTDFLSYFGNPEWGDLTDPKEGYDVIAEKIITGPGKMDVKYKGWAKKNSSPVGVDLSEIELFDIAAIPLETLYSYEEQELIYDGASREEILSMRKAQQEEEGKQPSKPEETKVVKKETKQPEEKQPMRRAAPEPEPKKEDPEVKYSKLIEQLSEARQLSKVEAKYQKWLNEDGSKAGLLQLIEMYGPEDETETKSESESTEEPASSGEEDLDAEIQKAMDKFKKNK